MKKILLGLLLVGIFFMVGCSHTHTYSETYSYDEHYHYHEATCHDGIFDQKEGHTFIENVELPTEDKDGKKTYTCSVCGYSYFEVINKLEHTHTFSDKYSYDEKYHYYESTCGHDEVKDKAEHDFEENTIYESTENVQGLVELECKICGYKTSKLLPLLDHTHKFESTYSYDEVNHYHASTCGHDVVDGLAPHNFDNGYEAVPATENSTGIKTYSCLTCDYYYNEVIPKLPHQHTFDKEFTYDENNHWHVANCGHDEIKGLEAHTYDAGKVVKPATLTKTGEILYTCKKCGYEVTDVIDCVDLTINSYNSMGKSQVFDQYMGLFLYKKGQTVPASLAWHKVLIKESDGNYEVTNVIKSGEELTYDYDYLLLSYNDYNNPTYDLFLEMNFNVGDYVKFSTNINNLATGSCEVIVTKGAPIGKFKVDYVLGFDNYQTKDDLYKAYFTDYYYFLINNTSCNMAKYNINNLQDFLTFNKTWSYNGRNEMGFLGDAFGAYYLTKDENGVVEDQPTSTFIGYCYQNNMYRDLIEFLEVFFAYWRTDEGYSKSDIHGNDFYYSAWASYVDTCKFFMFTSESILEKYAWYTAEKSPRVHWCLDNVPNVSELNLVNYVNEGSSITLPDVYRLGYDFLGWYDAPTGGNKVTTVSSEMTVYARFERTKHSITFMIDDTVFDTVYVNDGLRMGELPKPTRKGYKFISWILEDGSTYDPLNGVKQDIVFYSVWEETGSADSFIIANGYNTQRATEGYEDYAGIFVCDKNCGLDATKFWIKIALKADGDHFVVTDYKGSGDPMVTNYDYVIMCYNSDPSGKIELLKECDIRVGTKIYFDQDLSTLSSGTARIKISFEN